MAQFILIPVTDEMINDLKECEEMADNGEDKPCGECSLNGGPVFECLAEQQWIRRGNER